MITMQYENVIKPSLFVTSYPPEKEKGAGISPAKGQR